MERVVGMIELVLHLPIVDCLAKLLDYAPDVLSPTRLPRASVGSQPIGVHDPHHLKAEPGEGSSPFIRVPPIPLGRLDIQSDQPHAGVAKDLSVGLHGVLRASALEETSVFADQQSLRSR